MWYSCFFTDSCDHFHQQNCVDGLYTAKDPTIHILTCISTCIISLWRFIATAELTVVMLWLKCIACATIAGSKRLGQRLWFLCEATIQSVWRHLGGQEPRRLMYLSLIIHFPAWTTWLNMVLFTVSLLVDAQAWDRLYATLDIKMTVCIKLYLHILPGTTWCEWSIALLFSSIRIWWWSDWTSSSSSFCICIANETVEIFTTNANQVLLWCNISWMRYIIYNINIDINTSWTVLRNLRLVVETI